MAGTPCFIPVRSALFTFYLLFLAVSAAWAQDYETAYRLAASGRAEAALEILGSILKENPSDIRSAFLKARILADTGRVTEAIALLTELANEYPDIPELRNNLAALHAKKGDLLTARDILEELVKSQPDFTLAHKNLGDIYAALALLQYKDAAGAATDSKERNEAQRKIEALRRAVTVVEERIERKAPDKSPEPEKPTGEPAGPRPDSGKTGKKDEAPAEAPLPTPGPGEFYSLLQDWAKAWTERDAEKYLSFFADSYSENEALSPRQWRDLIVKDFGQKKWIKVSVSNITIKGRDGDRILVGFSQQYSSSSYPAGSQKLKEAAFQAISGRWVIVDLRTR